MYMQYIKYPQILTIIFFASTFELDFFFFISGSVLSFLFTLTHSFYSDINAVP